MQLEPLREDRGLATEEKVMKTHRNSGTTSARRSAGLSIERMYLGLFLAGTAVGQVTSRVSVDSSGIQGNGNSGNLDTISISADGRYVAFESFASNLVPGDTNAHCDIFVRDRQLGTTEIVSVDSTGAQADNDSFYPSVSADGRYVAFLGTATNLVPGDTNGVWDIFVHDRQTGRTERVSVDSNGTQGNDYCLSAPSISADGRYVAFQSSASNLVPGDANGFADVFVHDRQTGTTERVSVSSAGAEGNQFSGYPAISADGRYVAFASRASNFVPLDYGSFSDVFVHDRLTGTTERVSVNSYGMQGNGNSGDGIACISISGDGRYVSFMSEATNLVFADTNNALDVFVRDRQSGRTDRISVDSTGVQGNNASAANSISTDGRYVVFFSVANNLVPGDTNGAYDTFVHDRATGVTERVSVDSAGVQGDFDSDLAGLAISTDGRYVAFASLALNLVPGDTNGFKDVFVRDRGYSPFTSLCDAGVAGVIACPCSNPPSELGRGCDNSSSTGGAILSASGIAYLSMDSLVFTTSGEKPVATSIVLQGNSLVATGAVFGQGVRCAGGTLKRLYTKTAIAGSISAPDIGAGDPTVSVRSATLGDVIAPGQSRWYLVYYRDPIVLGGCPSASKFNATQTGRVDWIP
jgi:Tol biopolymer transport system component